MIWSGDPRFRTHEWRARQARAEAFAHLLSAARRGLARVVAGTTPPSLHSRLAEGVKPNGDKIARGCPDASL